MNLGALFLEQAQLGEAERAYRTAIQLGHAGEVRSAVEHFEAIADPGEDIVDFPAAYYEAAGLACGLSLIVKVNYTQVEQDTSPGETVQVVQRLQQVSLDLLERVQAVGYFNSPEARKRFQSDNRWIPVAQDPGFQELTEAIESQESDG